MAARRIDQDGAHLREVDDEPVVAERPPGDVVAAAPHRDGEVVRAGEVHRSHHVRGAAAAGDEPGAAVDGGVPDPPGGVIAGVARADDAAGQSGGEGVDGGSPDRGAAAVHQLGHASLLLWSCPRFRPPEGGR